MQKQTSPSREADNDVRDALESIVLQIEGPEEGRPTWWHVHRRARERERKGASEQAGERAGERASE
jgi:hypothetical protein